MTGNKKSKGGWQERAKLVQFVRRLEECGRVNLACQKVKAGRGWVYAWREKDEEFREAWDRAYAIGRELLKDEAYRRAHDGTLEPRFHKGEVCGTIRRYSDSLLMFLIKQSDPSYREHYKIDHGNADGRPFLFTVQLHPDAVAAQQGKE